MGDSLELLVVRPTAGGVNEAARNTRDEELVGNDELDDGVELLLAVSQHRIELLRLGNRPWEAVKYESSSNMKLQQ